MIDKVTWRRGLKIEFLLIMPPKTKDASKLAGTIQEKRVYYCWENKREST